MNSFFRERERGGGGVVERDTGENSFENGRVIWVTSNFKFNGENKFITIA